MVDVEADSSAARCGRLDDLIARDAMAEPLRKRD
jgi:hypothetical protein